MSDEQQGSAHTRGDDSSGGAPAPDAVPAREHPRRPVRTITVSLAGAAAVVVLVLGGIAVADHRQGVPAASSSSTPVPDPTPTSTPAVPIAAPSATSNGLGFALGADGSIADFPVGAPEGDVVAYLDAQLGPHTVSDPTMACAITQTPGRLLSWGDQFFVLVQTEVMTSPGDPGPATYTPAPPYVGGWDLTDGALGLRTREGLAVGDSVASLRSTYAQMPGQLSWVPPMWIWSQGSFQVLTGGGAATDRVEQIAAGFICPLD